MAETRYKFSMGEDAYPDASLNNVCMYPGKNHGSSGFCWTLLADLALSANEARLLIKKGA